MAKDTTPPTPPTKGVVLDGYVKTLVEQLEGTFKDVYKYAVSFEALSGLADPEIDKLAKSAVESVRKWLKPGNPLLHPFAGRGLGWFSGTLDKVASDLPEPVRTAVRKISDFVDSFRSELYGKDAEKHEPKTDASAAVKAEFQRRMMGYIAAATEEAVRLTLEASRAQTEEVRRLNADRAKNVQEAVKSAYEAMEMVLNGPEKDPEPKVPIGERFNAAVDGFNKTMEKELGPAVAHLEQKTREWEAGTKALAEKQKREAAAKQPSKMDKLLKGLSRVLFGFPKPT